MQRLVTALLVLLFAASAMAQGPNQSDPVGDYRDKLYIACTLVFVAITVFLILTHRRMSRTAEDVELLENRVAGLEGGTS